MAWLLRREIAENVVHGAKNWLGTTIDREMWNMYVSDTEDLICIHSFIKEGKISPAFECASKLDTAARDVIPTEVWNWMSNVHAEEKEHWAKLDDGQKYNVKSPLQNW